LFMSVVGRTGRFFGGLICRPLCDPEMILMVDFKPSV
jgi:hypothetical protein